MVRCLRLFASITNIISQDLANAMPLYITGDDNNAGLASPSSPKCSSLSTEAAYGVTIGLAISAMTNIGLILYGYKKHSQTRGTSASS